ncbi:MAG: hypothetical protein IKM32_04740 [Clostridia bacterium]|nr:hypothetical protein [Clostridia bacterium]
MKLAFVGLVAVAVVVLKSNESTAAGILPQNANCFFIFAILFRALLSR